MSTTAASVGVGLARPMVSSDPIPGIAQDYYLKFGTRTGFSNFMQYVRAREMPYASAKKLQDHLLNRFGLWGVAGHIPEQLNEGLTLSPDGDGRGGGVAGGSPSSEFSDVRRADVETGRLTCSRCGAPKGLADERCHVCNTSFRPTTEGSSKERTTVTGSVRVPSGPVSTSEQGLLKVKVLSHSMVEVTVNGVSTVHNWMVVTEAIAHRVSEYGRFTTRGWLPRVQDWLWNRSQVGHELVIGLDGKNSFVSGPRGFRYSDSHRDFPAERTLASRRLDW